MSSRYLSDTAPKEQYNENIEMSSTQTSTTEVLADGRFAFIITLLTVVGMIASGHYFGQIFPGVLVFFFIGLVTLVVLTFRGQGLYSVLGCAILLSVTFRAYSMYIPATVIGADTPGNTRWMQGIIDTGSVSAIGSSFYTDAPIHYLFGSSSSLILGVDPASGIISYAVLISIIVPLITIAMARRIGINSRRLLKLTVILALATTEVVRRTYWPIAQTHATVHWWLFLLVLIFHITEPTKRFYSLLLILTGTMALTHKLPLALLLVILIVLLLFDRCEKLSWNSVGKINSSQQVYGIILSVLVIMLTQWIYASSLLNQIISRISGFFINLMYGSTSVGGSSFQPHAAVEARVGILADIYAYPIRYTLFWERAHAIWLLLFGGIGWVILFLYKRRYPEQEATYVLLTSSAVCVSLLSVGFISVDAMNPTRPLLLIEPVLIVLIIGILHTVKNQTTLDKNKLFSTLLSIFVILILLSQIFAASAAADYNNTPRYYLDEPEVQAMSTLTQHTEQDINVDQIYAQMSSTDQTNRISRYPTDPMFNANISVDEHEIVAFRDSVEVYLGVHNRWTLTWEPSQELEKEYHTIYNNGEVVGYQI